MTTPPNSHPYAMYTAIHAQPHEVCRIAARNNEPLEELRSRVLNSDSTTLLGIGSSLHAAQISAALWREVLPGARVESAHSFGVAFDPRTITANGSRHTVICFSHRGKKQYSIRALCMAKELGAHTCLITGEGVTPPSDATDIHITTVPQEISSAHTVSILGSIATMAKLIELIQGDTKAVLLSQLQESISHALAHEALIQAIAARVSSLVRHIWIVGVGSDVFVAKEIALKIKETSYIPTEGMSVEEMLHGPFQCLEPNDTIIVLNTQEQEPDRLNTLLAMSRVIGVPTISVNSPSVSSGNDSIGNISVKGFETRTFQAVCALVALQLFTYFLALSRGKNPDSFRLDDPRFKEALALVRL